MKSSKLLFLAYITFSSVIIIIGIILRILVFDKVGGDYITYKDAMVAFHQGINPYIATVTSFRLNSVEHGFAYFPTLLYIQYGIWLLSNFVEVITSTVILWKIPVLVADFLILFFIVKKFKSTSYLLDYIFKLLIIAFWTLNPYLIARYDYSLYDPIFLLFILLALEKVETKSFTSGVFYALAVSLKTIPLILFPLFIIKAPNKVKFISACVLVFILISLPFMRSYYDFSTYLNGAFFVHSERILQGRPFLSFLSYFLQDFGISFQQHNFIRLFSFLALVLATVLPVVFFLKQKLSDKYSWTVISFFIYLLLTPVLSRTHILWIFPWLLIFLYFQATTPKKVLYGIVALVLIWSFSFFYLYNWDKGLEINDNKIVLHQTNDEWEFSRILRQKYYEIRGNIFK